MRSHPVRFGRWASSVGLVGAVMTLVTPLPLSADEPLRADGAIGTRGLAALITGPDQPVRELVVSGGQSAARISLIPKAWHSGGVYHNAGYYSVADISGSRLTVRGGGRTYWNMYIAGWGLDDRLLHAWQGRISLDSYLGTNADCGGGPGSCSGAGDLQHPLVPCTTSADCAAAFGEAKSNSTSTCAQDPHCRAAQPPYSGMMCETAFINETRSDWLFKSLVNPEGLCFGCMSPPAFNVAPICFGVFSGEMADAGQNYYAGTLVIDVPENAQGLYRLDWVFPETFYADIANMGYYATVFPGELMALGPCTCNGDVTNDGITNFADIARISDCLRANDCSGCINSCDVNCDGTVDYADLGAGWCDFEQGGSACCSEAIGACEPTHTAFPECVETTERACVDPMFLAGTYYGDNSSCPSSCGAPGDLPCAANEFCSFPVGTCGNPPEGGLCEVRPTECLLTLWDPVCGCDGVTYAYDCFAAQAGVSIDHWGECGSPACFATRSFGDTSYCPGTIDTVTIGLTPPLGTDALAVEDSPPAGWGVGAISNGGFYDAANHKVKWGPLFAPFPVQVSYELSPTGSGIQCFSGTVSVDGNNSALCGDPCEEEMCCDHMAAETATGDCLACAVGNCSECSTGACEDGSISLCEVISYGCAWMRGCNDDIGGMTRAAFIWKNGECYCWDTGSENWVETSCGAGGNICCAAGRFTADVTAAVPGGFSSLEVSPGDSGQWLLTVHLTPEPGTSASAVELLVPERWRAVSVSDGGQLDTTFAKIKWGPFFEDTPRTLTAVLQGPSNQKSEMGRPSSVQKLRLGSSSALEIKGTASFDGINQPLASEE